MDGILELWIELKIIVFGIYSEYNQNNNFSKLCLNRKLKISK